MINAQEAVKKALGYHDMLIAVVLATINIRANEGKFEFDIVVRPDEVIPLHRAMTARGFSAIAVLCDTKGTHVHITW
jgi:hypothetical protein